MKIIFLQRKFCLYTTSRNLEQTGFSTFLNKIKILPKILQKIIMLFLFHPSYDRDSLLIGQKSQMNALHSAAFSNYYLENIIFILKYFPDLEEEYLKHFFFFLDESKLNNIINSSELADFIRQNKEIIEHSFNFTEKSEELYNQSLKKSKIKLNLNNFN